MSAEHGVSELEVGCPSAVGGLGHHGVMRPLCRFIVAETSMSSANWFVVARVPRKPMSFIEIVPHPSYVSPALAPGNVLATTTGEADHHQPAVLKRHRGTPRHAI